MFKRWHLRVRCLVPGAWCRVRRWRTA